VEEHQQADAEAPAERVKVVVAEANITPERAIAPNSVFDYGQKGSADQMRTSWEKLVQYVGTTLGPEIYDELANKRPVIA
jgi:hypothetical protein